MPVTIADRHAQILKHARVLQSQIDAIAQESTQQIDTIKQQAAQQIALIQAELDRTTVRLELLEELLQDHFNNNVEIAEEAYLCQAGDTVKVLGKVCLRSVASTDLWCEEPT